MAVELERTAKGRARLRRILAGYVAARHISAVRYYVRDARVQQLVETEAAGLRATSLVEIRNYSAPEQETLSAAPPEAPFTPPSARPTAAAAIDVLQ